VKHYHQGLTTEDYARIDAARDRGILNAAFSRSGQVGQACSEVTKRQLESGLGGAESRTRGVPIGNRATPYPWCSGNPTREDCARAGYCRRDPNCGD